MPVPPREQVAQIAAAVTGSAAARGLDIEEVRVLPAPQGRRVVLVVDADGALDLDALALFSEDASEALDQSGVLGAAPYTLEVTSPGVDRPLTAPRHWRRAQGRKVKVAVGAEVFDARVGPLEGGDRVRLVVRGRGGPSVRVVALADIASAVVQVEFSAPDKRELALAGGVAAGKAEVAQETGAPQTGAPAAVAGVDDEELDN